MAIYGLEYILKIKHPIPPPHVTDQNWSKTTWTLDGYSHHQTIDLPSVIFIHRFKTIINF